MSKPNTREKLKLVADWLGYQDEQLSFGLRSPNDAVILYDAMCSEPNELGEMADEWLASERIDLLGYDPLDAMLQPGPSKIATRAKAAEFAKRQFESDYNPTLVPGKGPWHYGKVEIRELLDFIYGGPPRSKRERL